MDSLTQIVLGAAVGEAALGKKVGNKAMLWGAIAGTIPDLDVIGRSFLDDLTAQEFHRGFTHSLAFSLLMAPIFGWLLHRLYRKKNEATVKEWSWMMFLGFVTHPLLDCHTTWGTQFLWPFDLRIAYNNINVVDPIYTLPFLVLVLFALFSRRGSEKRRKFNRLGLIISSAYMLITIGFKGYTYSVFKSNLKEQHIPYERISNRPTFGNSMLWMANVETKDAYYTGLYSLLDHDKKVDFFRLEKNHQAIDSIKAEPQIKRLIRLTKGWYVIREEHGSLYLSDMRFGEMWEGSGLFFGKSLLKQQNGEWVIENTRPDVNMNDFKAVLKATFRRAGGDKNALRKRPE